MDPNDELDARSWLRLWRVGPDNTASSSQRRDRAHRFENTTFDLLTAGNVPLAMRRLDRLVELANQDEALLAMIGIGPLETIFYLNLDTEAVVRELESRYTRPDWKVVLLAAATAWAPDRLHLPGVTWEDTQHEGRKTPRRRRQQHRPRPH